MGREEGRGFRMGSTGIPVADSFRCWAKLIQYCKVQKKKKFGHNDPEVTVNTNEYIIFKPLVSLANNPDTIETDSCTI